MMTDRQLATVKVLGIVNALLLFIAAWTISASHRTAAMVLLLISITLQMIRASFFRP